MVLLIFKVVFLIVGAGAGYYLVNIFLTDYLKGNFLLIGQFVGIIIFAFLGVLRVEKQNNCGMRPWF